MKPRVDLPSELVPTHDALVIDLARAAGLDVTPWSDSKRGDTGASTNPKYCYEWAYVQPGELVVLNLWEDIFDAGDPVRYRIGKGTAGHEAAEPNRERRRFAMLAAIEVARREGLPIRVISRRKDTSQRTLDPVSWSVISSTAKEVVLERGTGPKLALEQDLQEIENDDSLSATEKIQLTNARIGQGIFRERLLAQNPCCFVTGYNDSSMLVASHIKAWRDCETKEERLDPYNGLLLTPNLDRAFDKHLITFDNKGRIVISAELKNPEALGIKPDMMIAPDPSREKYMANHRVKFMWPF